MYIQQGQYLQMYIYIEHATSSTQAQSQPASEVG